MLLTRMQNQPQDEHELYELVCQKLNEMKEKDPWDKARYIEKQSWAIMPGEDKPDSKVADACAKHVAAKA